MSSMKLAGLVHLHHRLLPVFPQTGLDGFGSAAPVWRGLASLRRRTVASDDSLPMMPSTSAAVDLVEELTAGVYPVLNADETEVVLVAEIQERSKLPDTAQRIAQPADDYRVIGRAVAQHFLPLRTELLLRPVLTMMQSQP